jgi:DNA-binding response OmpR family regulator
MTNNKYKKIYIIDDNIEYLNALEEKFKQKENYSISTYDNGYLALEDFHMRKPDLILLDNDMPEITGIEFVENLKKKQYHTNIIVVSNNISQRHHYISLGVKNFLSKPFVFKELLLIINFILEKNSYSLF